MTQQEKLSKSKLHGIWALTNRELKKWYQNPFILVMGIIQPVLWLALLGKAMNISSIFPSNLPTSAVSSIMMSSFGTTDYFSFMAMGMVAFTTVFTTAFVGMSVVWDRRTGFMNKVLSTPVSRSVIILSKVFAASVRAIFQSAIVTLVAFALGLVTGTNFSLISILGVFAIVFLLSLGLSSLFTALTLRTSRMETPQAVIQLITMPLMFASSAYFPIDKMPQWLQAVASVNPISYTIDAVRTLMIFSNGFDSLLVDFLYVGIFAVIVTAVCVVLSWRYLNK
jgi:ABC-2 type transport system permease protein